MRTQWVGIPESEVQCYSDAARDMVARMRKGETFPIAEKLVIRAVRRFGENRGFGLIVVQAPETSIMEFSPKHREQYLWLAEGWLTSHGIGPENAIQFRLDDLDLVPDAPEAW